MAASEEKTAYQIGYDLLIRTRDSLLKGDFGAFSGAFFLPYMHITVEGCAILDSLEDLRCVFDRVYANYRRLEVDDIVRPLLSAEFLDANRIDSTAACYIYSRRKLVNPPYYIRSELIRSDGHWQIASSNYAIALGPDGVADALMPQVLPSDRGRATEWPQ